MTNDTIQGQRSIHKMMKKLTITLNWKPFSIEFLKKLLIFTPRYYLYEIYPNLYS